MLPILLMEPDSTGKRRGFSDTLLRRKQTKPLSFEDIKKRLCDIRNDTVLYLNELQTELTTSLSQISDVSVSLAKDAGQAVDVIRKISDGPKIAVNKSAVITKELMPTLLNSGFQVIETYYDQFEPGESKKGENEQFPPVDLSTVFNSFSSAGHPGNIRKRTTQTQGSKNFTGLMGINAISAIDGSVVILQHMKNISKIFEQAKHIILVAGLDKIVANQDDAVFQTRSMAIYGWQALSESLKDRRYHGDGIDNLPFDDPTEQTDPKIHIILFDNGRSRLLNSRNKNILACMSCRACVKDCPASPFFNGANQWSPKEYLYALLIGKVSSFEPCLQCKACQLNCPVGIDLPEMILEARLEYKRTNPGSLTDTLLSNFETIAKIGSVTSPVSNSLSNLKPLRLAGEKMMNVSSERKLPVFQRQSFAKWFRSKSEVS